MEATHQTQPVSSTATAMTNTDGPSPHTIARETTAVTILLTNEQTALLDAAAAAIRRNTGVAISRSAMLRAIVSALLPFRQEWSKCQSAAQIKQKIENRLRSDEIYAAIQQRAAAVPKKMNGSNRIRLLRARATETGAHRATCSTKAVGYIRVSTEEQAANGYGLDVQSSAIRSFVQSQGYELVDIISDPAVSGAKAPKDRPGFRRVMDLAEAHAFSILVVWKFDRLARSLLYSVTTVNELHERHGVVLRSVTEPIDTATPMGAMIFAILASFAAEERRVITSRTLAGKKQKAMRGGFAGGPAPVGGELPNSAQMLIRHGHVASSAMGHASSMRRMWIGVASICSSCLCGCDLHKITPCLPAPRTESCYQRVASVGISLVTM